MAMAGLLGKELCRTVRHTFGQFTAIAAIVALGCGFFAAHPEIAAAKAALLDAGAVYAAMSGSGSAVFGLFDDEEKARSRSFTPFVFPL